MRPDVRYVTKSDGVHIAYSVAGSGDIDIVIVGCWTWSITEIFSPQGLPLPDRVGQFARVIAYDQRGTGMSDPVAMETMASLDQWLDDLVAVLDAAGCERAVLYGYDAAGPLAALFAATHPERTAALVLAGTFARVTRSDSYHCGIEPEGGEHLVEWIESHWVAGTVDPSLGTTFDMPEDRDTFVDSIRRSASPGAAMAITRMLLHTDVRPVLPAIHVPTLVIHGRDDLYVDPCHGRYLAEHIPGAAYCELPLGHALADARSSLWDEVEQFLTGKSTPRPETRVLATILLTDIVDSTSQNAKFGDHAWRDLLDAHDASCRDAIARCGGRAVKHMGDGVLAVFDGPGRAVQCAAAIVGEAADLGLSVRAGLHTGEVEVRGEDVAGMAVNIASRICNIAEGDTIIVSRTIADLVVGSALAFESIGNHELRGVPGTWELLRFVDAAR